MLAEPDAEVGFEKVLLLSIYRFSSLQEIFLSVTINHVQFERVTRFLRSSFHSILYPIRSSVLISELMFNTAEGNTFLPHRIYCP